jgi:hypothetical protein
MAGHLLPAAECAINVAWIEFAVAAAVADGDRRIDA